MSPNEITTLVASKFGKELDVPFKKMLYESVKYWRATLIKQTLERHPLDRKYFRQTIYLPMVRVDITAMTPGLVTFAAETTVDVPVPLRISDQLFDYIGSVDLQSPFGWADQGTLGFLKADKYARHQVFAQYQHQRVRTTDLPDLDIICISGIFNSPEEAMIYETMPAEPNLNWWDRDIPMSSDIEQRVVQCLLKVDFEKAAGHEKTDDYQTPVNREEL